MSDQDGSVAAAALIQGSQRINDEIPSRPSAEQVSLSVAPGWSCSSSEVGEGHLRPIISPALSSYPSPPPSLLPHGGGGWGLVGETQLTTRSRCHNFVILIWSVSLTFVHFFLHTCKITAHSVAVAPWLCCALTWWCYCTLAVLPPPRGLQSYDTPCHFPLCWTSFMLCQTPRVSFPKCFSVFLLLLSFCQFL